MAQIYELKAEVRDRVGKGAARAVRRQDKIPAVIYGERKPPIAIALPQRELTQRERRSNCQAFAEVVQADSHSHQHRENPSSWHSRFGGRALTPPPVLLLTALSAIARPGFISTLLRMPPASWPAELPII